MSGPATAREALIVEALGEVARLLDRAESLVAAVEGSRTALTEASARFDDRLTAIEARTTSFAQVAQSTAVDHIIRRTHKATTESIEAQTRAMEAAARSAFSSQVDTNLARLARSLQQALQRVDRPWDLWLTHAATAVVSSAVTWWVLTSIGGR